MRQLHPEFAAGANYKEELQRLLAIQRSMKGECTIQIFQIFEPSYFCLDKLLYIDFRVLITLIKPDPLSDILLHQVIIILYIILNLFRKSNNNTAAQRRRNVLCGANSLLSGVLKMDYWSSEPEGRAAGAHSMLEGKA